MNGFVYKAVLSSKSSLSHHGIKGQKWYNRRFQNLDGSLTSLGRLRYGIGSAVGGGLYDSSKTLSGRAKKLAKFGSALGKAKAEHYGRSISGKASGTMRRIGNALNTQRAEAERLRSYAHSLEMKRTLQMSINNLRGQKDYARRKEAAEKFIRAVNHTRGTLRVGSTYRFHGRTGLGGIGSSMSGEFHRWLTGDGDSAQEAVSYVYGKYAKTAESWRSSARRGIEDAKKWRSIARGH